MNKIILVVFGMLFPAVAVFSQVTVSGVVTDEQGIVIPAATVLIQKNDSSIIAHTITNTDGFFSFENKIPVGSYIMAVQCLGFSTLYENLEVQSNVDQEFQFELKSKIFELDGVEITARYVGIVLEGDTINYNPEAFKDGTEQNLGDLLNKLPGVEVDEKGNVTAQGKTIDKILLNSKDFFSGNTQIAAKNLPASLAKKVQILDNYSEYSLLEGFTSKKQTVINVEADSSLLNKLAGELEVGGGIYNRYKANGNVMYMGQKLMISLIGASNNTGDEIFSIEDYFRLKGGIKETTGEMENNSTTLELSESEAALLSLQNNTYSRTNNLSALNFSWVPQNELKVTSYFLYNNSKSEAEDLKHYSYNLPDNSFATFEKIESRQKNNIHNGYLNVEYNSDSNTITTYRGDFSNTRFSTLSDETTTLAANEINALTDKNARFFNTRHKGSLTKKTTNKLFNLTASYQYSRKPVDYLFNVDTLLLPVLLIPENNLYTATQHMFEDNSSWDVNGTFRLKLNEQLFIKTGLGYNAVCRTMNSYIADHFQNERVVEQAENDIYINAYKTYAIGTLVKNKGVFRFQIGTAADFYSFSHNIAHNLENQNTILNPLAEISFYFNPRHVFSLNYKQHNDLIGMYYYAANPVIENYNTYSHNSLVNKAYTTSKTLSLNYRFFHLFSNTMFYINGFYSSIENSPVINYNNDGLLNEKQPVVLKPQNRLLLRAYLNKGLNFIPWTMKFSGNGTIIDFTNRTNGAENKVQTDNYKAELSFESNLRHFFNFEFGSGLNYIQNSTFLNHTKHKQTINSYRGKIILRVKEKLFADVELEYKKNSLGETDYSFYFLNSSIRYIFSEKVEMNLSGMNMLNLKSQNWSETKYTDFYNVDIYYKQIPGHIMLRAKYKF